MLKFGDDAVEGGNTPTVCILTAFSALFPTYMYGFTYFAVEI